MLMEMAGSRSCRGSASAFHENGPDEQNSRGPSVTAYSCNHRLRCAMKNGLSAQPTSDACATNFSGAARRDRKQYSLRCLADQLCHDTVM